MRAIADRRVAQCRCLGAKEQHDRNRRDQEAQVPPLIERQIEQVEQPHCSRISDQDRHLATDRGPPRPQGHDEQHAGDSLALEPPSRVEPEVDCRVGDREGAPEVAIARDQGGSVEAVIDEGDDECCRNAPHRKERRSHRCDPRIGNAADRQQPGKRGQRQQVGPDQDGDARQQARANGAGGRPSQRHGKRADPERRRGHISRHHEGFEDNDRAARDQRRRCQRWTGADHASAEPEGREHEDGAAEGNDQIWSTGRESSRERHQERQSRRNRRADDVLCAQRVRERHERSSCAGPRQPIRVRLIDAEPALRHQRGCADVAEGVGASGDTAAAADSQHEQRDGHATGQSCRDAVERGRLRGEAEVHPRQVCRQRPRRALQIFPIGQPPRDEREQNARGRHACCIARRNPQRSDLQAKPAARGDDRRPQQQQNCGDEQTSAPALRCRAENRHVIRIISRHFCRNGLLSSAAPRWHPSTVGICRLRYAEFVAAGHG